MQKKEIRVRFAPSPTGALHIGGARTALFNWLFARKMGGKFVLRLEDTDTARSTDTSARGIIEGLQWLGLDWDEGSDIGGSYGPYRQSQRLDIYKKYITQLIDEDKAYYCFCSGEELNLEKEQAQKEKRDYKYSGKCRNLTPQQIEDNFKKGLIPTVRFKVPQEGVTTVHDLVRGDVEFNNNLFDDFIIGKSNGWPTYNFAVVIDDALMHISHVIRAEEHLSNTPKQLLIYEALDLSIPEFAHVSMILSPDRSKLSKRHGATSVQEFREQGYLPETLINYLALLGWSTGEDTQFMSIDEMINKFDLNDMVRSPAIYDIQKLTWMNGHYIAQADLDRIINFVADEAKAKNWLRNDNREYFARVIDLVRTRAKTVNDILNNCSYFFTDINSYDDKGVKKYFTKDNSVNIISQVLKIVQECEIFEADQLESALRQAAENMNVKAADLIHPARLAISGRTATPGLFEVMELLGRDKCVLRLVQAITYIKSLQ